MCALKKKIQNDGKHQKISIVSLWKDVSDYVGLGKSHSKSALSHICCLNLMMAERLTPSLSFPSLPLAAQGKCFIKQMEIENSEPDPGQGGCCLMGGGRGGCDIMAACKLQPKVHGQNQDFPLPWGGFCLLSKPNHLKLQENS